MASRPVWACRGRCSTAVRCPPRRRRSIRRWARRYYGAGCDRFRTSPFLTSGYPRHCVRTIHSKFLGASTASSSRKRQLTAVTVPVERRRRFARLRKDQFNDGNDAAGLHLVFGETGEALSRDRVDAIALLTRQWRRGARQGRAADFGADGGVGDEIAEPVRIGVGASLGGEHEDSLALFQVHHRVDAIET